MQPVCNPYATRILKAHMSGGRSMTRTPQQGVVRPHGSYRQIRNPAVHDGSVFPACVSAKPPTLVNGLLNKLANQLARELTARSVRLT